MAEVRNCWRKGRWLRCRDEWWLWLVQVRGCCFGFSFDRIRRELVLILGCRVLEFSAPGVPSCFTGGIHLPLSLNGRSRFSDPW